jgi:glycosyltransferase involved in cell wall biosynthesis
MKVLFLKSDIFEETVGGVESHILYLSKYLTQMACEIIILVPIMSNENRVVETTVNGVVVRKVFIKNRINYYLRTLEKYQGRGIWLGIAFINRLKLNLCWKRVMAEVDAIKPDIVHQHDYLSNIVVSKSLSRKYPVVFTNHLGQYLYMEKMALTRFLQKKLLSHYAQIIAPSMELLPRDARATYIPNGVDIDFFHKYSKDKSQEIKTAFGFSNKFVFLCPRRWAPTKGIIFLAEAINNLDKITLRKCIFLFAGSDFQHYNKYSKEVLKIMENVPSANYALLGNLTHENLRDYYNMADVVVIPSLMEATSLAALEAMACGVPILSTNVGGMPEIVTTGVNGWLVPPADTGAIVIKIKEIVSGCYDCTGMGNNGMNYVVKEMSWKHISKLTYEVYKKCF